MVRQGILIGLIALLALTTSCLEDNIDFPENEPIQTTESIAIVSLLNQVKKTNAGNQCFDFAYPITLGFNNDLTIDIESAEGLREVAASQNSGVHISHVAFPILVSKGSQLATIDTEQQLFELLLDCELPTLRSALERAHQQCFDFSYPITMIDASGNQTTLNAQDEFLNFYYSEQPRSYQPDFVFPLEITKSGESQTQSLSNVYELYQAINQCQPCPEVSFEYEILDEGQYKFTAEVRGTSEFEWFVDDVFITKGNLEDNFLIKGLDPGTHKVCIKARSADCSLGEVYCEEVEVENSCPSLFFDFEKRGHSSFLFEANFLGMLELASYTWLVNGEIVDEEGLLHPDSDHKLEFGFEPGSYEVCIVAETLLCPEGVKFCKNIEIECVEVDYQAEEEFTGYVFTADFDERDEVTYEWTAYIGDRQIEKVERTPASTIGHDFVLQMEPLVEYTVCIKQAGECAERKVCRTYSK